MAWSFRLSTDIEWSVLWGIPFLVGLVGAMPYGYLETLAQDFWTIRKWKENNVRVPFIDLSCQYQQIRNDVQKSVNEIEQEIDKKVSDVFNCQREKTKVILTRLDFCFKGDLLKNWAYLKGTWASGWSCKCFSYRNYFYRIQISPGENPIYFY